MLKKEKEKPYIIEVDMDGVMVKFFMKIDAIAAAEIKSKHSARAKLNVELYAHDICANAHLKQEGLLGDNGKPMEKILDDGLWKALIYGGVYEKDQYRKLFTLSQIYDYGIHILGLGNRTVEEKEQAKN